MNICIKYIYLIHRGTYNQNQKQKNSNTFIYQSNDEEHGQWQTRAECEEIGHRYIREDAKTYHTSERMSQDMSETISKDFSICQKECGRLFEQCPKICYVNKNIRKCVKRCARKNVEICQRECQKKKQKNV